MQSNNSNPFQNLLSMMNNWQQPPAVYQEHDVPPARVRIALDLIGLLTSKTATRAAACDTSITDIPGQPLTNHEQHANDSACQMLSSYFDGTLDLNTWEESLLSPPTTAGDVGIKGMAGTMIRCFMCAQSEAPRPGCVFCKGQGNLLVFPVAGD